MPIQGKKIFFEFDPFELIGVDAEEITSKREAKQRMAEVIREEVLNHVGQAKSPVAGESWKASLSPGYKKYKAKYSSAKNANMELFGDMLDALDCVVKPNGNLELRVQGKQAPKADGHNNHSGKSTLPQRRFIPDENQTFKREIIQKLKIIADEYTEVQDYGDEEFEDDDEV